MSTANASSSCNAAIELRTSLTPPLPPPPGLGFSSCGDENIGACMDGTGLPKAPVLALERSATERLSMVDDASFSTDESPSCALDSPRSLLSVVERQKTPPSNLTACPLPAPALESSAGVSSVKCKKPRDPGLSINTDIDDHEVDVRFIKAIRSRRLNLNKPVFGTVEYHRMQLRALAKPIYWGNRCLVEPVRYRPLLRHGDLMYFYAPPPQYVAARRPNPRRKKNHQCLPLDWLTGAFKRVRSRITRASQ
ncbi:hypothetical protein Pmar_PMAR023658 [Perkinsus marinus ATCC 50983]|uniref:Uncharacterized protein n=1 Tax=Perkinsus marinus (strain ATCC 50983 / TXsc) TaxID=423536 RepID=C5KCY2_PERM5|nr:hypothetical protein Pmar_PMAR023658 [Perkinsus marinus ATCC 50983]EER17731.1 hypothetical protein Pmar_PMAR023658 [Perkinsus marinus ATCC 50983]|eukprot:XP_002785935.1 hypothetical protein Pmar_PMAR023658 [Perkinsus marinus ATCC 50983]